VASSDRPSALLLPAGAWPHGVAPPAAEQGVPPHADVASWWAPHADLDVVALAAQGPGFLDALAPVAPEVLAGVVPGPAGSEVPVALRRRTADAGGAPTRPTVYVDASQVPAAGDAGTLGPGSPDPTVPARSSTAVGHLLALAVDAARDAAGAPGRVVLATGSSTSHDAG